MTQFDPSMVAEMLMQPVGRESLNNKVADENYFEPIEIPSPSMVAPLDMDTGWFMSPETAGKVAYGTAVTGASFFPGAGVVDAAGGAVDVTGQPLPSFSENIGQGNYLDAALQGLGVAGDVATVAAPATLGTSAVLGALLKAPGAARKVTKATDIVKDFKEAPSVFGEGARQVDFIDQETGSKLSVIERNDETSSVIDLFVPEEHRGKGIGFKLQQQAMDEIPDLMGQVSSKAAAVNAYRLGRRPVVNPDATLEETLALIDQDSSVNMLSPVALEKRSDVGSIAKVEPQSLPLDKASKLERARELGFDVDNPIYHGTNTDELTEFDESTIGSRDEGFFGRGFYFADNAGEARYYGKNVGEYFVRGDLLDLTDTSGEPSYLGSPLIFINWAEKLDKIDMLDDTHKQALNSAKKLVKYYDDNVEFLQMQNSDGSLGFSAKIVNPTREKIIDEPDVVFMQNRYDANFPSTKEEAKERLFYQFANDVRRFADNDFFEGYDDDFFFSLSDYIREGGDVSGLNASKLTEKAKAAGFDGVRAGDETVIFDAKNIRSSDAAFDPEKTDSPQLLSSVMQDSMTAVA